MTHLIKITRSSDDASLSVRPVADHTWSSRSLTVLLSIRYRGVAEPGLRSTSPAVTVRVRVCRGSVLSLSTGTIIVFPIAQCAIVCRTKRIGSRRYAISWAPVYVEATVTTTAVTMRRIANPRFRASMDFTERSFSITPNGWVINLVCFYVIAQPYRIPPLLV